MYRGTTEAFARAYAHWFYLIEPAPFPERMIGAGAEAEEYWRRKCGSGSAGLTPFAPQALAEYLRCFRDPATVHATCEDYRAAASIDIRHDDEDAGRKLTQPLLALWGRHGVIERCFDCLSLWRARASDVSGEALPGGHYLAEEVPDLVAARLAAFMTGL
jgi:haloacetate dehalogenase